MTPTLPPLATLAGPRSMTADEWKQATEVACDMDFGRATDFARVLLFRACYGVRFSPAGSPEAGLWGRLAAALNETISATDLMHDEGQVAAYLESHR